MHYAGYEWGGIFGSTPFASGLFGFSFIVIILWVAFWKGLALWTAAKRDEKWWFIAFLFINTVGILEIVYLFLITKEGISRIKRASSTQKAPEEKTSTNEEKKS